MDIILGGIILIGIPTITIIITGIITILMPHNTYYGPHYKKSNGDKKIKTVKTVSKVKSKPVNNQGSKNCK